MARRTLHLLLIDAQNDFCDLPEAYLPALPNGGHVTPALPVPGAHQDMLRVAELIRQSGDGLTDISVTLDSHHHLDIAHPSFWRTGRGEAVAPFTQIAAAEVQRGDYAARLGANATARVLAYLTELERRGRYRHMVWPTHCEIGSWGHNLHADVRAAYNAWEERTLRSVTKVVKGTNPWTEHYSAIQAEVPDESDADTLPNLAFVDQLRKADRVYIAGEAGSHCVRATTEHLAQLFPRSELDKLVLVTDCMSPVSGFESAYREFLSEVQALGLARATAAEAAREISLNA